MTLTPETIFTALGLATAAIRYSTYLWLIYKREARPHVFSWLNWGLLVGIATILQYQVGGGGSILILASVSFFCLFIAVLSLFYGEKNITRGDWITFLMVLVCIPIWLLTKDPLLTFFVLVFIDLCSYYPTWRKMWVDPWSEPVSGFFWSGLRYMFAILAVPEPGFMTVLYPFWLMAADWGGGVYGYARRKYLARAMQEKL